VHEKGNYWHCFAGCGGGSIIDFWMKWKKIEFGEAVHQLEEMLEVE
jgi:DNA primase